jgi:hypothetical protein
MRITSNHHASQDMKSSQHHPKKSSNSENINPEITNHQKIIRKSSEHHQKIIRKSSPNINISISDGFTSISWPNSMKFPAPHRHGMSASKHLTALRPQLP